MGFTTAGSSSQLLAVHYIFKYVIPQKTCYLLILAGKSVHTSAMA
jgi:hypothetical protein